MSKKLAALATQLLLAAPLAAALPACITDDPYAGLEVKADDGKEDSSAVALFVDLDFDGSVLISSSWDNAQTIEDQLLYTVGQLNGFNAVGRVDRLVLSDIRTAREGNKTRISYHAKLPAAWDRNNIPASVTLKLPADIGYDAQDAFAAKYGHTCIDVGAHDVDAGSMFYYFRPRAAGCTMTADDTLTVEAAVSPSPIGTTGRFPEYDKVWEDNTLQVVAVFGKYEDGATTASDAGVAAYNEFVRAIKTELRTSSPTTEPASIPSSPGVAMPDITVRASLADGRKVEVHALLVDNVTAALATPTFKARYEELSTRADFLVYNGHAGLGTNVRALARHGKWVAGQYVIVFMNGCDTYAYVDDALNSAHAAVNGSADPTGTRHVDIVLNAMPAFFARMSGSTMAMFRGLMATSAPKTYEQIFAKIDSSQVVLVTGEHDNVFTPGGGGEPTPGWTGLTASGPIAKNAEQTWSTPTLPAGAYSFTMTGTGDADLYVRIGQAPTTATYDCRPYLNGSDEICNVTLAQPAPLHVMVRGYAASSTFDLRGAAGTN